jgi:ATP-binding cassette subfamily C protein
MNRQVYRDASGATATGFFRPIAGQTWFRTIVFVYRMLRIQPFRMLGIGGLVVATGLVEGLGLGLLLPLLSLIGIGAVNAEGGPARSIAELIEWFGLPLELVPILALFVFVVSGQIALTYLNQRYLLAAVESLAAILRKRLFHVTVGATWATVTAERGSAITSVIVNETQRIGDCLRYALTLAGVSLVFLIYVGFALWLTWEFTLVALGSSAVTLSLLLGIYRKSVVMGRTLSRALAQMQSVLKDHVDAFKLIRAMGLESTSTRVFANAANTVGQSRWRILVDNYKIRALVEMTALVLVVVAIYISVAVIALSPVEIVVMLAVFYRLSPRMIQVQELIQRLAAGLPAFDTTAAIVHRLEETPERKGGVPCPQLDVSIRFDNVSIRHSALTVLDRVSFSIAPKNTVALIGPSGAGKTTILDLLSGLRTPDEGEVCVGFVPLRQIDLATYRQRIALVTQEAMFLHDTVGNNLRLVRPDADDSELWAALEAAHVAHVLRNARDGLNTVLGDNAVMLSGGQRQRLALARALLRRPELLLLDEPTSGLDPDSERVVLRLIRALHGSMTIVVATHRLSDAWHADCVLELRDGDIAVADLHVSSAARLEADA